MGQAYNFVVVQIQNRFVYSRCLVKTTGELRRLIPGLTHDRVNNLRKLGLLRAERQGRGRYAFSEKAAVVLEIVHPELERGMKPTPGVRAAEEQFKETSEAIRDAICEYQEGAGGYGATLKDIERVVRVQGPGLNRYVAALLEEHELAQDRQGRLSVAPVFELGRLRARTKLAAPAYLLLDGKKKVALREEALKLYLSETQGLRPGQKIPVPLTVFEREKFTIEYRNLPRNCFGGNDPSKKTIFLSSELERGGVKKREVLMHE